MGNIVILDLPAYEMELLDKMAVHHDYPFVGLFTAPLLMILGLIYTKRYFGKSGNREEAKAGYQ